ncbi:LUD domain-containing protein, partial [candidate division KSB1 bacterium]
MESRTYILESIRTALQAKSQLPMDPDLDATSARKLAQQTPKSLDGLVEQFRRELDKVAAEFTHVESVDAAVAHVRTILEQENESSIVIAGAEAAEIAAHLPASIAVMHPEQWEAHDRAKEAATIRIGLVNADYAIADSGTLV